MIGQDLLQREFRFVGMKMNNTRLGDVANFFVSNILGMVILGLVIFGIIIDFVIKFFHR